MLAISTTWNFSCHSNIEEQLLQIKEVGFDAIEIGYNFTDVRLKELKPLLSAMDIKVASVHNFCPLPPKFLLNRFFTDYYRLSAPRESERRKAVDYTKRSVDTARSLSCGILVIHAGTIEIKRDYTKALFRLYNEGKFGSGEYLMAKQKILVARQKMSKPYIQAVTKSLDEVLSHAHSMGVKIGLETRYYPHEIPNIQEAEDLLNRFNDKGLVYWHDIGHGEANERLSITAHSDFLSRFAKYMHGIHLHDLIGIDDHMAPFSGDFDFSRITPYMNDSLIKVIEAHPPATPEQIKEAVKRLS